MTEHLLVIKVGTNSLMSKDSNGLERLNNDVFENISCQINDLRSSGYKVVLVSSGAITAGMISIGLNERPDKETEMPKLQSLASIGWRSVLNAWDEFIDCPIGELLVTRNDFSNKREKNELLAVVFELLEGGSLPLMNENDALSHEEISFGDNDTLASHFAVALKQTGGFQSVRFILLTDVNGLYRDYEDPESLIKIVECAQINDVRDCVSGNASKNGTGGMSSKLDAASIACANGIDTFVAGSYQEDAVKESINGNIGTRFLALSD